jgi:hypothetical protein
MTEATGFRPWAPAAVALLTTGWGLALLMAALRVVGIGLSAWADQQDNGGAGSAALDQSAAAAATLLAGVAVGGPALIAVVAFAGRLARTSMVYVALTVVLGTLALLVMAGAERNRPAPADPAPGPSICQERSGGDTRCPGG